MYALVEYISAIGMETIKEAYHSLSKAAQPAVANDSETKPPAGINQYFLPLLFYTFDK